MQSHELTFFNRVTNLLYLYNFLPLSIQKDQLPSRLMQKHQVREAINKFWGMILQREANDKSTLKFLCISSLHIGYTRPIWENLRLNIDEKQQRNHYYLQARIFTEITILKQKYRCNLSKLSIGRGRYNQFHNTMSSSGIYKERILTL